MPTPDLDIKPGLNAIIDIFNGVNNTSDLDKKPAINELVDIIQSNTNNPTIIVQDDGVALPYKKTLNFVGATITNDTINNRLNIVTASQDLSGLMVKANNLSDLTNIVTARTNLGLGTLATQSGTFSGTSSGVNTGDQDLSSYATNSAVASGLNLKQNNLGFTPENITNKATTMTGNTASDAFYLSAKAVFDWATGLFAQLSGAVFTGNISALNLSNTNTGDETITTIKSKLGITTLSGSNTGDQTITLSGDVTGSGISGISTTLANTGVTAGTYRQQAYTFDAKGRITATTNYLFYRKWEFIDGYNGFISGATGSAATTATGTTSAPSSYFGTLTATTGSTATGASGALSGPSDWMGKGSGITILEFKFRINNLSDATDTYSVRNGFIQGTTTESVNGLFVRYSHSVNSGKFEFVTRQGSTETATDTGVMVVAGTDYTVKISLNAAMNSATCVINSGSTITNTTNIPTFGQSSAPGMCIIKTVGVNTRRAHTDYYEFIIP